MALGRTARLVTAALLGALVCEPAVAQQMYIYPSQGQSPEQQNRDRYECHTWSVRQTGIDPTNPYMAGAPPAQEAPQGGLLHAEDGIQSRSEKPRFLRPTRFSGGTALGHPGLRLSNSSASDTYPVRAA